MKINYQSLTYSHNSIEKRRMLRFTGILSVILIVLTGTPRNLWADLNVTLIERTARYNYDALKNHPEPNDIVMFHGHVINWLGAIVSPEYLWKIDDVPVEAGIIPDLAPGEERILDLVPLYGGARFQYAVLAW